MQTQLSKVNPSIKKYSAIMVANKIPTTKSKSMKGFNHFGIIVFLKCSESCARINVSVF
jgi:hypothetical protein